MRMNLKTRYLAPLALVLLVLCAPRARAVQFSDVPEGFWAAGDIALCTEQGFFDGESADTFGVGRPMQRGTFVSILSRFFGWEAGNAGNLPYSDVQPGDWYAPALAAAYSRGAVTSQADTFRPAEAITREELAVTLVRALGYRTIAGLVETAPFSDVTTNTGYLAMAHNLGLMNGSGGLFMPDNSATREQTAAVMARLYRKLHGPALRRIGITASAQDLMGRGGWDIAAVQAVRLASGSGMNLLMSREAAAEVRNAARSIGAEAFLCAGGDVLPREAVSLLAEEAQYYDGVFLNLSTVPDEGYLRQLKESLGERKLYTALPAPTPDSTVAYKALAEIADGLVLRVEGLTRLVDGFPSDPVEPVEAVYDTLRLLLPQVDMGKVSLFLNTSGNLWTDGNNAGTISGRQVEALLREPSARTYFSERYNCAYLRLPVSGNQGERVVWYLDGRSAAARLQLLRLFGAEGVCVEDIPGTGDALWSVLP